MSNQIRCYKTDNSNKIVRFLRNRKSGVSFIRIFEKREDGKFYFVKDDENYKRCELCGKFIIEKKDVRFCCDECGEEFFRRETIDCEENMLDSRF